MSRNIYARSNATFDYIVVGAGLGGLRAAELICEAGKSFLVLEASKVPGGRVHTVAIGDLPEARQVSWVQDNDRVRNFHIEKGATWLESGHDSMFQLAKDLGISLRKQYAEGEGLYLARDQAVTSSDLLKDPLYGKELVAAVEALGELSSEYFRKVLATTPQDSASYAEMLRKYDGTTILAHLKETVRSEAVVDFLENMIEHTECAPCDLNSMHELLTKNACSKDIEIVKEFLGLGDAESFLVEGGTHLFVRGLLKNIELKHKKVHLGDSVKFGCVVKEIANDGPTIVIRTLHDGRPEDFRCLKAVINVPLATLRNIRIGRLSEGKRLVVENQLRTTNRKSFVICRSAFWRKLGFSGDCLFGRDYPVNMSHDISPASGDCGVLVFFHNGRKFDRWEEQFAQSPNAAQEKKAYLAKLMARLFLGGDTSRPELQDLVFAESTFMQDEFIGSGFQSNTQPGTFGRVLDRGDDLEAFFRDENGLVFVGSEYSREFASYMEGAVRCAAAKFGRKKQ